jgi:UDP-glucose 4-epimerase
MAKVLVTGATGFVGRALCPAIRQGGHSLRMAVRSTDSIGNEQCGIGPIDGNTDWHECLRDIDVVIHLAARVHVMRENSVDAMQASMEVNHLGTAQLARQAAAHGVKRFIYLSSIKVNGEYTENQAFTELSPPMPLDTYASSKLQAELALKHVAIDTGMEFVVLRPPLIYGPGVKANFFNLMKLVDSGLPLPFGRLQNHRSLLYVGNLVDAIMCCIEHPAAANQTFLLCDGETASTPELISELSRALGRPLRICSLPMNLLSGLMRVIGKTSIFERLTQSLVVDDTRFRVMLDWHPPYSLTQGIQITADWYRKIHKVSR